jgi:hypothetical protein
MSEQLILTPCPPRKHCRICEARLSEVFGSADHTNKYLHQASEAGMKAIRALRSLDVDAAVALTVRAASFANLALNNLYQDAA